MKKKLSLLIVAACLWLSPQTLTAQVTIQQPEVTVNVETPGTLGDLILQQTENLTDVVTLHVGGTINDADVKTLQERLTRLRNLDAFSCSSPTFPRNSCTTTTRCAPSCCPPPLSLSANMPSAVVTV